jgi:hypothetical protein
MVHNTRIHSLAHTISLSPTLVWGGLGRSPEVEVADSSNLTLPQLNDFSWSLHTFHFFELYFWSIFEFASLNLSGTGDTLQLRVE